MKNIFKFLFVALALVSANQINVFADDDRGDTENIKLFKKTTPVAGEEDTYLITLNSFVTGTSSIQEISKPVDIILSLDVSTSMAASRSSSNLLSSPQYLFHADSLSYLHTERPSSTDKTEYHNYKDKSNSRLRYRIEIKDKGTYNFAYFEKGQRYDNAEWKGETGWYYGSETNLTQNSSGTRWTRYTANSKDDLIKTDVKLDLLENACRAFINLIYQSATKDGKNIDHRIGLNSWNTSVLMNYDIAPVISNYQDLINNVTHLKTATGTHPDEGLTNAKNQLDNLYKNFTEEQKKERSRVVVLFTDGEPNTRVATIINTAKPIKADSKLFAIGIFKDEDGSAGNVNGKDKMKIKEYMSWMSSEYPNATGNTSTYEVTPGDPNTDGVHYYQKSDGSDLSSIFKAIARSAGADTYKLTDSDMAAIDVMSDDFTLPENVQPSDISLKMYVCNGKDVAGIGGYSWSEYKKITTDKIYDGDEPVANPDYTTERVEVKGFFYALDDTFQKDKDGNIVKDTNGKPIITQYGNWVGEHPDGQYAGKMLEISFKVKLKSSSMGGYGLPSNKISSGIYVNTAEEGQDPVYKKVAAYPRPVINVPSIMIIKEGLQYGESAVFTVERKTRFEIKEIGGEAQTVETDVATTDKDYIKYNVIVCQTNTAGGMCYSIIKDLEPGKYEVAESAWTWTYTADTNFRTKKTLTLNEPEIPIAAGQSYEDAIAAYKATIKSTQDANWATFGNDARHAAGEDEYYVHRDALHLLYRFANTKNNVSVLNGEAFVVNVFGAGGGSAEHGGVDPEEHDWE